MSLRAAFYLFFAVSMAFGQQASLPAPDAIFFNGKIITVNSAFSTLQAFAVQGDRIVAAGSNAEVQALAGPRTQRIDLGGHAVIPGLMDNHNHQYNAALMLLRGVNLVGVPSVAEMLNRIRQAVATAKPGQIVYTTGGWSEPELPEKRGPTRQELDQVSPDHPVMVFRTRGTAYLNTPALKAAGVSRETPFLAGNPIAKDATGEPTGVINGPSTVLAIADKIVPQPSEEEKKELILKMQQQQHAVGLTSIRELELSPDIMRLYWSLWREGKLTMRVSMGLDVAPEEADEMEEILSRWGVGPGFGDHWLRLDCVGEFGVDGIPNSSYLREPYAGRPGDNGQPRITPEKFGAAMRTMNRYGWRPSIHTSGDKALDLGLDGFEAADRQTSIRDKRWIVEHIPMAHPDQMERLARMKVLVSAQAQPYGGVEGMIRAWGRERADHAVPMRELLDHGLIVSTGSDWPTNTNNMFVNMGFYVTRKTREGGQSGAAQKISRQEALRVATINNAYMTYEEKVKGSIEPGKLADFLILSQDILTVPEDQIRSILPLATYVGGRKVFAAANGGF